MRISDWSSDVCSSDLVDGQAVRLSNDALIMSLSSFVFIKPGWVGDDNASVVDVELPDSFIWKCLCNSSGSIKRMTKFRSEEHTSELQSLMRISYAVFCLQKKITQLPLSNNSVRQPRLR